jgi:tetratricopeptide (TPR) repeat protein
METLGPPECHYLSAAQGWIGLGNLTEAEAELERIGGAWKRHPDVLEVRWMLAAGRKHWGEALQVARSLLHVAPERVSGWVHQAYALRRSAAGGLEQAWEALLPAADRFPSEPIVPYNLSCYACQMQRLDVARKWLRRAMTIGDREFIRKQALADPDLQPLWREIGAG